MSSVPAYSISRRRHRPREGARRRRPREVRRRERARARHARAAAARREGRAPAHPRRLGRAQHRPRLDGRHRQHRRARAAARSIPATRATGEVLAVGALVTKFQPGDIVITHCNGGPDEYGFPTRIWAYDADDSIGWYAKEAVVGDWQIIRAPLDCGLSLWEIAAMPLRAPTAYHLWRRALGIYRLKVPYERRAHRERARLRRRRLGAVPPAREVRGPRGLLLRRQPRAARSAREAGHRRHRPEAVQSLRGQGRREGVHRPLPQAHEAASRCTSCATCCAAPSSRRASRWRRARA